MCGIFAIIGGEKCFQHCIEGLKQLQNRGYDSAGICSMNVSDKYKSYFCNTKFASTSTETAIEKVEQYARSHIDCNVAIAHSRWSTTGQVTDANAHPHIDYRKTFSLVHNGIIENYQELKDLLIKEGYHFSSETDSEVVVNLISYEYFKLINSPNLDTSVSPVSKAISNAIKQLHGGYALVIISVHEPDRIYCIRKGNPILVGLSDTIGMIASEESAFNGKVNNYILLDDENLCWLNRDYRTGKINFTATCQTYQTVNNVFPSATVYSSSLGDFPHWTLKEIHEQPDSINRALTGGGRLLNESKVKLGGFERFASQLIRIQHLIILGCGTSYHAAMIAEHYFKDLCHFQSVQSFDGAEFNVNDFPRPQDPVKDKIGCIFLSQSGETQDLYRCIKIGKQHNAILIGVVNVVDSLIAREVDCGVYLNAGREVAVASTKSFTSQLTVLMLIAMWFSQNQPNNYLKRVKYMDDLHKLPKCVSETIALSAKICPDLVKYFDNFSSCFLLGKGTGEGIALEGALKIKEISYIHAEGYSASSLKHGPFALLQKNFPVIIIALDNDYFDKCLNAMEEILSRGATVIFITNKVLTAPIKATVVVQLPTNTKCIGDTLAIIPLQMLAYHLSISRGITPDFPRNLAKVVTVE